MADKHMVFSFGRFNPPTVGHEKLLDAVAKVARGSKYMVFASQSNDAKKNPLDYATKKDVRFFDMVDEKTMETLSNINAMFNSQAYKGMRDFSIDYEIDINGDLKKVA